MMPLTTLIYVCALLMDLCVAAFMFGLTRRAAELHASALELGLLGGCVFITYCICALTLGSLSDRWGRRRVAVGGSCLGAVMALSAAFTVNIPLLLVLGMLLGLGISLYWPSIIAWLGEHATGQELAQRMARFSIGWNTGLLIGFALTGYLFQTSPRLGFYVAGGGMGLIALLLLLVRTTDRDSTPVASAEAPLPAVPKGRGFRKTAWLASFGVNFATSAIISLFPQLATTLGVAPDIHGNLLALSRLAAVVVFWALQYLHGWRVRLWPLWVAQGVCALALTAFGWASATWLFAVAFVISGAVSGYVYQASIFFTLEEMTEKGKGSGFHESIIGSGMFLGPVLAGMCGSAFGFRTPYYLTAMALATFTVVQMLLVARQRR